MDGLPGIVRIKSRIAPLSGEISAVRKDFATAAGDLHPALTTTP
jgi:hypothetical protein